MAFDKYGNEIKRYGNESKKEWYPDIEKTKKNIHEQAVLEQSTQVIKANFHISPEWISETTHDLPPTGGRKHAPWSYEYPGALRRESQAKLMVENDMVESLKARTPRV